MLYIKALCVNQLGRPTTALHDSFDSGSFRRKRYLNNDSPNDLIASECRAIKQVRPVSNNVLKIFLNAPVEGPLNILLVRKTAANPTREAVKPVLKAGAEGDIIQCIAQEIDGRQALYSYGELLLK